MSRALTVAARGVFPALKRLYEDFSEMNSGNQWGNRAMLDTVVDRNAGFAFGETVYRRGGVYGTLRNRYAMRAMLHSGVAEVAIEGSTYPVEKLQTAPVRNQGPFEIRCRRSEYTHVS